MVSILSIDASQRLDSRGNPTVQVTLVTEKGAFRSLVPSGASKGDYEAIELRDADQSKYHGQGVLNAIDNIRNVLGPKIMQRGFELADDVDKVDRYMVEIDGSENKGRLGANAILAISMAAWRAAAAQRDIPLYEFVHQYSQKKEPYVMPVPFFNVLNGGVHSGNTMAFQEFMIAPVGADSTTEAIRIGTEVYHELKKVIIQKYGGAAIGVGDEGGFAPPISYPHEALDLLTTAIDNCCYGGRVKIGIDPASTEFFRANDLVYDMAFKSNADNAVNIKDQRSSTEMSDLYQELLGKYPIILLEDPFAQDDWQAWTKFQENCSVELVGDDLLATNRERIAIAREKQACNALLLKINQIGTITEAIDAAQLAYSYGWSVFVSHRSGETTDDFIADLTVGLRAGHLKSGSPCRGERVAKYNRLMDIEEELVAKEKCIFANERFRESVNL